jgi:hypothetical protein
VARNFATSSRIGARPIASSSSYPLQGTRLRTVLLKPRSSESNTSWRRSMGLHRSLARCWLSAILPWPTEEYHQHKRSSSRTCASRACRRCPPTNRRRRQLLFDVVVQHHVKEVGTVRRTRPATFQRGDKVRVNDLDAKRWSGRATVLKIRRHGASVWLRTDSGYILVCNQTFLKPLATPQPPKKTMVEVSSGNKMVTRSMGKKMVSTKS